MSAGIKGNMNLVLKSIKPGNGAFHHRAALSSNQINRLFHFRN